MEEEKVEEDEASSPCQSITKRNKFKEMRRNMLYNLKNARKV